MDKFYIPFLVALAISYGATPFAKRLAYKVGAIDVPKDNRRVHKKPIPRLGGLAIYLGTIISMIIFLNPFDIANKELIYIIIGATIIVAMGIIDDIKPLSAKLKLLIQILAAYVLVRGGIRVEFLSNPFDSIDGLFFLNKLSTPVTIFWIIGITNTVNLIDGLDGLAAGVGSIAAMTMLFVAVINGYTEVAIMSAILAGSAFGFLPHNFNPAKIFMGDTGSLFLGYMLSVIAINGLMKSVAAIGIVVPILALGIPIFDTTFAIFRRALNKRPIFEADKGHLHHRLLDRGLSQKQTVIVLYMISMLLGVSAILITNSDPYKGALILAVVSLTIILGAARLGLMDVKPSKGLRQDKE